MTPLPPLTQANEGSQSSSEHSPSPMAHSDRPERSRNAKAQARHRAKRKAYIEQLEQTVTKLQSVLALSPEQVGSIPPPVVRIRELESENMGLRRENEILRHQLEERNASLRPDITRRTTSDDRRHDRDMKRRRTIDHPDDVYMTAHSPQIPSPPPPLLIPNNSPQYPSSHSSSMSSQRQQSSHLYSSYGAMSYQLPGTPSASSATSSPSAHSFSPIEQYPPSTHSTHHHRPSSSSSNHTVLPPFSSVGQYEFVKIEEEPYAHNGIPQPHSYSTNIATYQHSGQASHGHWQQPSYPPDRT